MRSNIVIDDALILQAMLASDARSKREAVELGLRTLRTRSLIPQSTLA